MTDKPSLRDLMDVNPTITAPRPGHTVITPDGTVITPDGTDAQ